MPGDRLRSRFTRPKGERLRSRFIRPKGERLQSRFIRPKGERLRSRFFRPKGERLHPRFTRPRGERLRPRLTLSVEPELPARSSLTCSKPSRLGLLNDRVRRISGDLERRSMTGPDDARGSSVLTGAALFFGSGRVYIGKR